MPENLSLHPGYYRILRFEIVSNEGEGRLDMSAMIPELYIQESMDNDSIRGRAMVIDKTSLLESLPLRGEERIIAELEDAEGETHSYDLFLYKVDNVEITGPNDGLSYAIHFCSFSKFVASLTRVCKSYDSYIHEVIEDIFENHFNIETVGFQNLLPNYGKLSETSKTNSVQHIVVPNMFPGQAIDFVTRRAYSEVIQSSSFRFYENSRGYHFRHDEDTYKNSPEPINYTFSDSIPKDGSAFLAARYNLLDLQNSKRINTMADISSGGYRNEVVEIDVSKKEVITKSYDHASQIFNHGRTSGFEHVDFHTNAFSRGTFTDNNARKLMVIKTNTAENPGSLFPETRISDLITSKIAYRYHLDKIQIQVVSQGTMKITCGDLINLEIYQIIGDRDEIRLNEQLSGVYMVRSLERQFVRENYRNAMTLSKATWVERNTSETYI